jgi:hypothetical protein
MSDEPEPELDAEALQQQLASFQVEHFVLSAASTLASLAHAKLERGDLPQAKKAIDVLVALVPHVEGDLAAELRAALANLQVAYAGASTP